MEIGKIIAFNIKHLRMERNLSLTQLSEVSGVSKAMLSDIEKGNGNPTINTIWKIANGLKVPYTKLMDGVDNKATLVRKCDAPSQSGETDDYKVYCYYPTTPTRNFELFYVELQGNSSNSSIGHSDKAQEYVFIIEGQLTIKTDNTEYILEKGDSLTFDSSIAHTYFNSKNDIALFMVINYYPSN